MRSPWVNYTQQLTTFSVSFCPPPQKKQINGLNTKPTKIPQTPSDKDLSSQLPEFNWAMKKNTWLVGLYIRDYTTQWYRDYSINHYKDPYETNQYFFMERFFWGHFSWQKTKTRSQRPGALPGSGLLQTILYPLDNAQCLGFDLCLGASGEGFRMDELSWMSFWGSGWRLMWWSGIYTYIDVYRCP